MCKFNKVARYAFIISILQVFTGFMETGAIFLPRAAEAQVSSRRNRVAVSQDSIDSGSDSRTVTSEATKSSSASQSTSSSSSETKNSGIKVFDPFLDNHLKAPPDGIRVGKFGQAIKEVENELRALGAKNHSYAFGKYSKMILSSYLVTLSFDVNKRLGMVEIRPKPPLTKIGPKAKDFFVKLFTEGADMSQIGMVVSSNCLELRFLSPNQ